MEHLAIPTTRALSSQSSATMAFYMEYPKRKVPHGIPPAQHPEPPSLETSVRDLATQVATTAETLSPLAPCLSPRMQPGPQQLPLQTLSYKKKVKQIESMHSSSMEMKLENLACPPAVHAAAHTPRRGPAFQIQTADRTPQRGPEKGIEGILYPSRAVSPRPVNQNKRVTWPDMEPPEDSTQKVEEPKTRAHAALDDLFESVAALRACCGIIEKSTVLSPPATMVPGPQSPLETVYEVERNPDLSRDNLRVFTDLPIIVEPVGSPTASDPIMSFREKKLSSGEQGYISNGLEIDESLSDDSGVEARDEISTSDGEDWAPVSRPLLPPPPPPTELPLQMQLRNEALMRDDERREHERQERQELSHATPHTKQVMHETILQGLPPEPSNEQQGYSRKQSDSSILSGTTWTLHENSKKENHRKKMSPRIKLLGFRSCRKQQRNSQPRFAEIEWKSDPHKNGTSVIPMIPREIDSWDLASMGAQSQDIHLSEISWRSPQGRKVAKMKNASRGDRQEKAYIRQESFIPGPEVKEWEREIKQVLSSLSVCEVLSSDSEFIDDRYVRSKRTKQKQQLAWGMSGESPKGSNDTSARTSLTGYLEI